MFSLFSFSKNKPKEKIVNYLPMMIWCPLNDRHRPIQPIRKKISTTISKIQINSVLPMYPICATFDISPFTKLNNMQTTITPKKDGVVRARIPSKKKEQVNKILNALGLTESQAINVFYSYIINTKGIPFSMNLEKDNKEEHYTRVKNKEHLKSLLSL